MNFAQNMSEGILLKGFMKKQFYWFTAMLLHINKQQHSYYLKSENIYAEYYTVLHVYLSF